MYSGHIHTRFDLLAAILHELFSIVSHFATVDSGIVLSLFVLKLPSFARCISEKGPTNCKQEVLSYHIGWDDQLAATYFKLVPDPRCKSNSQLLWHVGIMNAFKVHEPRTPSTAWFVLSLLKPQPGALYLSHWPLQKTTSASMVKPPGPCTDHQYVHVSHFINCDTLSGILK